jgi:pyruvyl transferase EpsO
MNQLEKVYQSSRLIRRILIPMIDNDYVIYGLPYHNNVGDVLIWEGELEILKDTGHRCLGVSGYNERCTKQLSDDTVILIHGGRCIGDLWRNHWRNMLKSIDRNKHNKIIILPSAIYYTNEQLRDKDAEYLSEFSNLTICVRDSISFDYAKKYFSNQILLLPDMAFAIDPYYIKQLAVRATDKELYLKRQDCEEATSQPSHTLQEQTTEKEGWIRDWPTMCCPNETLKDNLLIGAYSHSISKMLNSSRLTRPLRTWMFKHVHRKAIISRGVKFISSYEEINTTRLHGLILAILLGKKVNFVDESYGKIKAYYDTWLQDCDNVRPRSTKFVSAKVADVPRI